MRRREFIAGIGSVAAWPRAAWAQQPRLPVVGFLRPGTAAGADHLTAAFRRGLKEAGYAEGQNVTIEYRWAEGEDGRLRTLAADLVSRRVDVIAAGASAAALAAKAETSTIPIVFVTAVDPVKYGLVRSLNEPGANATGVSYLSSALAGKRLELLRELVPAARSVAALVQLHNPTTAEFVTDLRASAELLGLRNVIVDAGKDIEIEKAFATLLPENPDLLVVGPDPFFTAHAAQIVALAARHALPAAYTTREFAQLGGLMAWGTSLTDQYRLAGTYVGRILNGARPAQLPVLQPTKYELVLNLKTAATLGITVPTKLLALADEVIE